MSAAANISLPTTLNTTKTSNDSVFVDNSNIIFTTVVYDEDVAPVPLTLNATADFIDEDIRRIEYYRSNPLRNYAPTRGQPIIPLSSRRNSRSKRLPSAFRELRRESDRSGFEKQINDLAHKYKLKADLKVNLSYTEEINKKNLNDVRENTKKLYNEYCHRNITKPVEIRNGHPLAKTSTLANHNAPVISTSINAANNPYIASMDSIHHNSMILDDRTVAPMIDVKRVRISTLEDLADEIKHKNKNNKYFIHNSKAVYDNYDNKNVKYTYKEHQLKLNEENLVDTSQSNLFNNTDSFLNHVHYEIDEMELLPPPPQSQPAQTTGSRGALYKRVSKKSPLDTIPADCVVETDIETLKRPPNTSHVPLRTRTQQSAVANNNNNNQFQSSSLSYVNVPSIAQAGGGLQLKPEDFEFTNLAISRSKTLIQGMEGRLLSPSSKQRQRIQHARDKISSLSHHEKEKLNKLTIIQPFEDTKILINLDQVPTKALNSLFNYDEDQKHQPSYLIPPVKAFGFYTSKTSLDNYLQTRSHTPPATLKSTVTRSTKVKQHQSSDNRSENGTTATKASETTTTKNSSGPKKPPQSHHHKDNESTSSYVSRIKFSTKDYQNVQSKFIKSTTSNIIYTH